MKKKMKMIKYLQLVFVLLLAVPMWSQEGDGESISRAHQLLQNKEYEEAKSIYLGLIDEDFSGTSLFYNLGIAYYESGDLAHAILYFEKALKLEPGNSAIQHNLSLSNQKLGQDFIELEEFFLKKWWLATSNFFSTGTWTFLFILIFILLLIAFFLYIFKTGMIKLYAMRIFYPGIVVTIIIFLLAMTRYNAASNHSAAIIMESTGLYLGPDERSEILYELQAGTRIILLDELEGWIKIELINKEHGWMGASGFEKI